MKKIFLLATALFTLSCSEDATPVEDLNNEGGTEPQQAWTVYNTSNSALTFDVISDIEFDNQGNKWIASWFNNGGHGIAKFDDTHWTLYNTENAPGTTDIHRLEFSTGALDIGVSVYATALVQFANGTEASINSEHNSSTNTLTIDIPVDVTQFQLEYYIEDSSSVDMVFYNVTTQEVIHQETFQDQMFFNYDYTFFTHITSNQVIDISIDNEDNKWIGTWQNGLMKFDDTHWTNFTTTNSGLPNDKINCVVNDHDGHVWIGTPSGLTKFDGSNWTTYNNTNSNLPTNSIVSIAIDQNNQVWLTTANELVHFTGHSWHIYSDIDGNWFGGANSLRIDHNNKKWMSGGYGIYSFYEGHWEYFNYFDSPETCLVDCQTTALGIDINNEVWLGSFQECSLGGLLNFSQCEPYLTSNSGLPENNILSLNIDAHGIKWIGTYNGLAKFNSSH